MKKNLESTLQYLQEKGVTFSLVLVGVGRRSKLKANHNELLALIHRNVYSVKWFLLHYLDPRFSSLLRSKVDMVAISCSSHG